MNNKSRLRANFKSETELTDALTGFAFYEAEQNVGNNGASESFEQRYMYAGLKGGFGATSFYSGSASGIHYTALQFVTAPRPNEGLRRFAHSDD